MEVQFSVNGYRVANVRKAIWGFLSPVVPVLYLALQKESPGGSSITSGEWLLMAASALGISTGVFAIGNAPKEPAATTPKENVP